MIDFNIAVQGATITGDVLILAEDARRVLDKVQVELNTANERIAELEKKLWRTEQKSEQAVNRAAEMIEHRDGSIAELEKLGNEMEIIIADLRAHLKIRGE